MLDDNLGSVVVACSIDCSGATMVFLRPVYFSICFWVNFVSLTQNGRMFTFTVGVDLGPTCFTHNSASTCGSWAALPAAALSPALVHGLVLGEGVGGSGFDGSSRVSVGSVLTVTGVVPVNIVEVSMTKVVRASLSLLVIVPSTGPEVGCCVTCTTGFSGGHLFRCRKIPNPRYTIWTSHLSISSSWWIGTAFNIHQIFPSQRCTHVCLPLMRLRMYKHIMSPLSPSFTARSHSSIVSFFVSRYYWTLAVIFVLCWCTKKHTHVLIKVAGLPRNLLKI